MARKIDQLGRVVLPAEMRRMFGINQGDLIEIFVDSGRIVLAKVEDQCVFCGGRDELKEFELKRVCVPCVGRLTTDGA